MSRFKCLVLMAAVILTGCGFKKAQKSKYPQWIDDNYTTCVNNTDSTFRVQTMYSFDYNGKDLVWVDVHPGDTFPPDRPWWYPDTITVAFTRHGKFVDSIKAGVNGVPKDSFDGAYVFRDVVGHAWYYNLKGKLVEFVHGPKAIYPESKYEP